MSEVILKASGDKIIVNESPSKGLPKKTENTYPKLRFLLDFPGGANSSVTLKKEGVNKLILMDMQQSSSDSYGETSYKEVYPANYQ